MIVVARWNLLKKSILLLHIQPSSFITIQFESRRVGGFQTAENQSSTDIVVTAHQDHKFLAAWGNILSIVIVESQRFDV